MTARQIAKLGIAFCVASGVVLFGASGIVAQDAKTKAKSETKASVAALIDLNSATPEELDQLPGVGEATVKKIIAGRPYNSVDDLTKAGLTKSAVEKLKTLVTARAPAKAAKTSTPNRVGPIDVNAAGVEELQALPGIGPALAEAIVKERPFKSFADMDRVKGLGPAKITALNGRIKFGSVDTPAPEKARPASEAKGKKSSSERATTPPASTARTSVPGPSGSSKPKSALPAGKVNINTAKKETLDALPGIGPVKAQAIIEARPFRTIEDIKKVKGIKDGEFKLIQDLITVK
jgi:competence protein ComEA